MSFLGEVLVADPAHILDDPLEHLILYKTVHEIKAGLPASDMNDPINKMVRYTTSKFCSTRKSLWNSSIFSATLAEITAFSLFVSFIAVSLPLAFVNDRHKFFLMSFPIVSA